MSSTFPARTESHQQQHQKKEERKQKAHFHFTSTLRCSIRRMDSFLRLKTCRLARQRQPVSQNHIYTYSQSLFISNILSVAFGPATQLTQMPFFINTHINHTPFGVGEHAAASGDGACGRCEMEEEIQNEAHHDNEEKVDIFRKTTEFEEDERRKKSTGGAGAEKMRRERKKKKL